MAELLTYFEWQVLELIKAKPDFYSLAGLKEVTGVPQSTLRPLIKRLRDKGYKVCSSGAVFRYVAPKVKVKA